MSGKRYEIKYKTDNPNHHCWSFAGISHGIFACRLRKTETLSLLVMWLGPNETYPTTTSLIWITGDRSV